MAPIIKLVDNSARCKLGEGPHWHGETQSLLYVDIMGSAVYRYVPTTGKTFKVDLGETDTDTYNSIVIPVQGQDNKYIFTSRSNVKVMEWDGESSTPSNIKTLHSVDPEYPDNNINDGKCDASGRLWAGTLNSKGGLTPKVKTGSLYGFGGKDGKIGKQLINEIRLANGLAWSLDNKTLYYVDTADIDIKAYDFDLDSGAISNGRIIYDLKVNGVKGFPDGMTIDSNGNLWLAVFDGSAVINIDPNSGQKLAHIELPVTGITSVAFGGKELDTLYVTSCNMSLLDDKAPPHPDAGALFAITNLGVKGVSPGINYSGPI